MAKTAEVQELAGAPVQEAANGQTPVKAPEKVKKERSILIPILTVLLVLVGIGELVLIGFLGLSAYRGIQERKDLEAQQAQDDPSETAPVSARASYSGPWRKVEAGTVVWTWEEDQPPVTTLGQSQPTGTGGDGAQDEDAYPRTPSSPPASWITLAHPDARPAG